jgi:hypothetical protein
MKLVSYFRGEAFQRGVHPPSCKLTAERKIRRLPFPDRVTVPLSQHIGKTPRPIVRVGQEVVRGQPIARSDEWLSVPHHAPLSGVVEFLGLQEAFLIMAGGVLVVGIWSWFLPSLRHMDDTVGLPGEQEGGEDSGRGTHEVSEPGDAGLDAERQGPDQDAAVEEEDA